MCSLGCIEQHINYITLLIPECFVLMMDTFLLQCVFEVNWDMMFIGLFIIMIRFVPRFLTHVSIQTSIFFFPPKIKHFIYVTFQ